VLDVRPLSNPGPGSLSFAYLYSVVCVSVQTKSCTGAKGEAFAREGASEAGWESEGSGIVEGARFAC
jgi:hypothetical protein